MVVLCSKFVRELEGCIELPEKLGPLFRGFLEKKINMYEIYCRNKPVSEYIVSEHENYFHELRHKLGHKLQVRVVIAYWKVNQLLVKCVTSKFQ
ncbi:jg22050 [Pararge aegeria aegeria]|uniref:Jg22050 protein n=1 Tax=Pararge aegeria aegeria TaxID=348720 RepID=A0A8S4QLP9_9NEOP|nr:jg22050 [Pararge aegeria aegeria]